MDYLDAFTWHDQYAIDRGTIDAQHKYWLSLAMALVSIERPRTQKKLLTEALQALFAYTGEHFATEVAFMQRIDYPRVEIQQEQHARILKEMNDILTAAPTADFLVENYQHLAHSWLVEHILGEDLRLKEFLDQRGLG